jgi:Ca-activated chloride channel family protein
MRRMLRAPPPAAQLGISPSSSEWNREAYAHRVDNELVSVRDQPLSTFSIDVDTASYSNVRRFLREGRLPPADAVRVEELINYFDYAYPPAQAHEAFSVYSEVGPCPWNPAHRLVHIGLKGREIQRVQVPPRNLVFLVDVSGSMNSPDKLPLLQRALDLLTGELNERDRIAIVVYAGASGLVLPSTSGAEQARIRAALAQLQAGGPTAGAAGIELAYAVAQQSFMRAGINRVILATDGDFNVGPSSEGELVRIIEQKRKTGVYLTVLGFGTGNLQDQRMEQLADKGNGNYAYIDSLEEAHKVLVREAGSTLITIAKDVKLQLEFNPAQVESYRLIGYENRLLGAHEFNDDSKDAGEIGAGHTVTALYEVALVGSPYPAAAPRVDPLRYQATQPTAAARSAELLTLKLRYKPPHAERSALLTHTLRDSQHQLDATSSSFRFAAAVAGFGMLLRSQTQPHAGLEQLEQLAEAGLDDDPHGERREFLGMLQAARRLGLGS